MTVRAGNQAVGDPSGTSQERRTPVRLGTAVADDGAQLGYRVDGEGKLAPLVCSGALGGGSLPFRRLSQDFASSRAVVTWDYRWHGRSPQPGSPDGLTLLSCARDLLSVVAAVPAERPVLIGYAMGVRVVLEALRLSGFGASAVILMCGSAGGPRPPLLAPAAQLEAALLLACEIATRKPEAASQMLRAALRLPGLSRALAALGLLDPSLAPKDAQEALFAHLRSLDVRALAALGRDLVLHDGSDMLEKLSVPTLVIAAERDSAAPLAQLRDLAGRVAGAELLVVPGGSHAAPIEQAELVSLAVEKFLRERVDPTSGGR